MNNPTFTHYTVVDGSLRPKSPEGFSYGQHITFARFAEDNEFPIANPEAVNGRTEIPAEEVELYAVMSGQLTPITDGWNYTDISGLKYFISNPKEPTPASDNTGETLVSSSDYAELQAKYERLEKVSKKVHGLLQKYQSDLPDDIQKIVNDNFWNLT